MLVELKWRAVSYSPDNTGTCRKHTDTSFWTINESPLGSRKTKNQWAPIYGEKEWIFLSVHGEEAEHKNGRDKNKRVLNRTLKGS